MNPEASLTESPQLFSRWLRTAGMAALLAMSAFTAPAQAAPTGTPADSGPAYGAELEGFEYPYPVKRFTFTSQRQSLQMAYLDVPAAAARANGQTAVLLHGKNYCAATWDTTIKALSAAGYRVIAPDQLGFCKSSKPQAYQFSFDDLARNTNQLLHALNIDKAIIVGHSTGGMLAMRYALNYPAQVSRLVLVDPIGLEDWRAKGVPPISVDQWYQSELKKTADGIRNYERKTYFADQWDPSYEPWVQMLAGMFRGPGKEQVAWDSALLYDMILTQPVYYQMSQISVPTLLIVGDKDITAIGKQYAPPELRAKLGDYPRLAKEAAATIPHAKLIEFPDAGHAPQMQYPDKFNNLLITELGSD